MKTRQQITSEAQQLTALGNQYLAEQIRVGGLHSNPPPKELMRFPESRTVTVVAAGAALQREALVTFDRYIEVAIKDGALSYRLMETEAELSGFGRPVAQRVPTLVIADRTVEEPLQTGYELEEEERLADVLSPYSEKLDQSGDFMLADQETVAEVEELLESDHFSQADKIRSKADVIEFLEGRLDPSTLIARTIERQTADHSQSERMSERTTITHSVSEP
mgnify:CR=1 FL=1